MGEQRIPHPNVRRDRSAEIAGQEHRTERRGRGHGIEDHAREQDGSEREDRARGEPELRAAAHDLGELEELGHGVQGQEQDGERAQRPAEVEGSTGGRRLGGRGGIAR